MPISSGHIKIICQGWLFIFLLLSGCGFHLRGEIPFSDKFTAISIITNDPYSHFVKDLTRSLSYSNVLVVPESDALYIFEIKSYSEKQQIIGYDPKSQLTSVDVYIVITFSFCKKEGKCLINNKTLSYHQTIGGSMQFRLGLQTQGEYLFEKIRKDLVQSILYQLASKDVQLNL